MDLLYFMTRIQEYSSHSDSGVRIIPSQTMYYSAALGYHHPKPVFSRKSIYSLLVFGMKFPASSGRRTQTNSNQQKFSSTRHQRKAPVQGFRPFRFLQQVTKVKIWDIQCVQPQVTELLSFAGLGNSIEFLKHTH